MRKSSKDKINIQFGEIVRQRREKLGLSQEVFAELTGIHRTYVSSIELGKVDIGLTIAQKISKTLKTQLSNLIKDVEKNSNA